MYMFSSVSFPLQVEQVSDLWSTSVGAVGAVGAVGKKLGSKAGAHIVVEYVFCVTAGPALDMHNTTVFAKRSPRGVSCGVFVRGVDRSLVIFVFRDPETLAKRGLLDVASI